MFFVFSFIVSVSVKSLKNSAFMLTVYSPYGKPLMLKLPSLPDVAKPTGESPLVWLTYPSFTGLLESASTCVPVRLAPPVFVWAMTFCVESLKHKYVVLYGICHFFRLKSRVVSCKCSLNKNSCSQFPFCGKCVECYFKNLDVSIFLYFFSL